MILSNQAIKYRCKYQKLLQPYVERSKAFGMTYGVGPASYDVRIAQSLTVPSGGFVLASTLELFTMPNDLLGQVCDKSTWVRKGLTVQNSIIDPGWTGFLTLELINHSEDDIELKNGMPICQIVFMRLTEPTREPYRGKYHNQADEPVDAILE